MNKPQVTIYKIGGGIIDDAIGFWAGLPEERRDALCGICAQFRFASLAVIPIRYREQVIGVIHMADSRREQFPAPAVEFVESMAPLIGEAVHRAL